MSEELSKIGGELMQKGGKPALGGVGGIAIGAAIGGPIGAAAGGAIGIIGGLIAHLNSK